MSFRIKIKCTNIDTDVPMGWAAAPGYELEATTVGANEEEQRYYR